MAQKSIGKPLDDADGRGEGASSGGRGGARGRDLVRWYPVEAGLVGRGANLPGCYADSSGSKSE